MFVISTLIISLSKKNQFIELLILKTTKSNHVRILNIYDIWGGFLYKLKKLYFRQMFLAGWYY